MPEQAARILVSVLAWNDHEHTAACLRELAAQDASQMTVVLLDNGSEPGIARELRALAQRHRIGHLRSERNLGFAAGHARVLGEVDLQRYTHVVLLNNDATASAASLLALVRAAIRHRADVAGPAIIYAREPSRVWQGGGHIHRCLGHVSSRWKNTPVARLPPSPVEVDFVSGCVMAISTATLGRVGFLDPRYFYSVEDWDYCHRVRQAGGRILFVPGIRIPHELARSAGGWMSRFAVMNNLWGRAFYLRNRARPPCRWLALCFLAGVILPYKTLRVELAADQNRAGFLADAWRALRLGYRGIALGLEPVPPPEPRRPGGPR